MAAVVAAVAARDLDGVTAQLADEFEAVHHPTGATLDLDQTATTFRTILAVSDFHYECEPIAALGDSLALGRQLNRGGGGYLGLDVGEAELLQYMLVETRPDGKARRGEVFADDRLGDAIARLYERHAELHPEGPERARAAAAARSMAPWTGPLDFDRCSASIAPDVEVVDRRILGTFSGSGGDVFRRGFRGFFDVAGDTSLRVDEVLALECDALLMRRTITGTDRASGGRFERPALQLIRLGASGLVARMEMFEPDRDAEALARFDALAAEPPAARFGNAATRTVDEWIRCQNARDRDGAAAIFAPDVRLIDRRPLLGLDLTGGDVLANFRVLFDQGFRHWRSELLATRGERLALFRGVTETEDAALIEFLVLTEVDASSRASLVVVFDAGDLGAAHEELDQRYAVGEGAPFAATLEALARLLRLVAARDWDHFGSMFAAEFVLDDHRPLGWGTLHALADFVTLNRAMVELRPDAAFRIDHVLAVAEGSLLLVGGWAGSDESGAFEIRSVIAWLLDADRRIRRIELFTIDQLDAARLRYAELEGAPSRSRPAPP
jgi:hypothetical protein